MLSGSEIEEVVIESNERVVIKLRNGMAIVVKPSARKARDIHTIYSGSKAIDIRVNEIDDKTYELCKSQSLLEISIRAGKKDPQEQATP
jgi:hypothetical protein